MAQSNEYSFPFDAEQVDGTYDRTYVADDFAQYFRAFISSGIFLADKSELKVVANGDMTVSVEPGKAIIDGYRYELESRIQFTIDPADGTLNRIDRLICVWDKEQRDIHIEVRKGTASYNPAAAEKRWSAEYKDLVLADIYVAAGVISIQQANITDQRTKNDLCGLATPFEEIDFDAIREEFDAWFDNLRNVVDENAAVHLQNEIDALDKKTTAGIKEVDAKTSVRLATKSLTAAGGTVSWTDASITDTSLIEVYATIPNISPSNYSVSGTTLSVTFDEQEKAFDVCATVRK